MKRYAILVGGGSGKRMNAGVPKQFLLLNGFPVLMHTLNAFYKSDYAPELVLVLNVHQHQYWEDLCKQFNFAVPHTLVKGGNERFDSVKNGLKVIKGNALVAVHDAVRPLVSNELICRSFDDAEAYGNSVAAIKSTDSIRQTAEHGTVAVKRDNIYLVQTPQTFSSTLLKKAYAQPWRAEFTDDASVAEKAGSLIHITEGEKRNIKITWPEDIALAEIYLNKA